MRVCVYVYVCACVFVRVCVLAFVALVCVRACACVAMCLCACLSTCLCTCLCACLCVCVCVWGVLVCVCVCEIAYVCAHYSREPAVFFRVCACACESWRGDGRKSEKTCQELVARAQDSEQTNQISVTRKLHAN